ncbi:hypothetical protein QBC33DRAFT_550734 [Phialemonium atrogriseum]|uniref:GRF-like zinc ribbon domain-containing protein n=1 Tax=Phialemonium atrogriseum TaxID=1093897 RepID=A0AAJ0BTZ5_9PEZI|nr:uncharacterized protein QBC33DRAFT_550734 [Phialemonium atrogriseum]KAK1763012.1 hypothetical protein QBC33DRAFT_550734 [Phialemonium atrogriseum]
MPYFSGPPTCRLCGEETTHGVTNSTNTLGNADRPYYACRCEGRKGFFSFDDYRGIQDENPPCNCGRPSRCVVRSMLSELYIEFLCATGVCDFKTLAGPDGSQSIIHPADIPELIDMGRI